MKACIYARTCTREREHHTTRIDHQVAFCREVARQRNVVVDDEDIYTDPEKSGALMPACWSAEGEDSRPALSEMVLAIQDGRVAQVLVKRIDNLGTSSEVLHALLDLFTHHGVHIVATPEQLTGELDPRTQFAISVLRPRIQVESEWEQERRERLKARKIEEIQRLQARIARLEAEVSEL